MSEQPPRDTLSTKELSTKWARERVDALEDAAKVDPNKEPELIEAEKTLQEVERLHTELENMPEKVERSLDMERLAWGHDERADRKLLTAREAQRNKLLERLNADLRIAKWNVKNQTDFLKSLESPAKTKKGFEKRFLRAEAILRKAESRVEEITNAIKRIEIESAQEIAASPQNPENRVWLQNFFKDHRRRMVESLRDAPAELRNAKLREMLQRRTEAMKLFTNLENAKSTQNLKAAKQKLRTLVDETNAFHEEAVRGYTQSPEQSSTEYESPVERDEDAIRLAREKVDELEAAAKLDPKMEPAFLAAERELIRLEGGDGAPEAQPTQRAASEPTVEEMPAPEAQVDETTREESQIEEESVTSDEQGYNGSRAVALVEGETPRRSLGELVLVNRGESREVVPLTPPPEEDIPQNRTPSENWKSLKERVAQLQEQQGYDPALFREARSQVFAEKYGLSQVRDEMLKAEREYQQAMTEYQSRTVRRLPWREFSKDNQDIRDKYDQARSAWRKAVFEATADAPKKEQLTAKVIAFRDTVMREEEARIAAHADGLDVRSKTLFHKVSTWAKNRALDLPRAYMVKTEAIGTGLATRFSKNEDKEQAIRRYVQATRILSSAAIGTALFGGFAALGAGAFLDTAIRAVRGVGSVTIGTKVGYKSGIGVRRTVGEHFRNKLREVKRTQNEGDNFAAEERAYRRGKTSSLRRQQQAAEIFGAFVVGGATAYGTGLAASAWLGDTEVVQNAADEVNRASSGLNNLSEAANASDIPPTEAAEALKTPVIESMVDEPGEGTDRLLRDLKASVESTLTPEQLEKATPAMQHFLENHENVISREMGDSYGTRGIITQPGDRFYFDEDQNLYFDPKDGKPQLFLENSDGKVVTHAITAESLPPQIPPEAAGPASNSEQPLRTSSATSEVAPVNVETGPEDAPSTAAPLETSSESQATSSTQATENPTPSNETIGRSYSAREMLQGSQASPGFTDNIPDTGQVPQGGFSSSQILNGQSIEPPAPIEVPQTEPSPSTEGGANAHTAEEMLRGLQQQPLSWTPENPLPQENSIFTFRDDSKSVFANAATPEQGRIFALDYGSKHPGIQRVYFDNSTSFLGIKTERVGMFEFNRYGELSNVVENVADQNGQTLTQIDRNLLQQRIV